LSKADGQPSYKVLFALVTLLLVAAMVFPLFAHWFY
jgi:hypothetical protein